MRLTQEDRDLIRAVKLDTEVSSVMKLLRNMSGLSECDKLPELMQRELQTLGLDYDSGVARLLALYKHVNEPKIVFTQKSDLGIPASDKGWTIPIKEL
jgi:hypothetical protein